MSLINREALLSFEKMDADLCATCGEHHTAEDVIMMIKTAPTVDAVPVVRCSECKLHASSAFYPDMLFCVEHGIYVDPNGYCYLGEQKEGAE